MRLLISTWLDNKHLLGVGKATKKDVFEKIAQQFSAKAGRVASGEQCLRKWGKLCSKHKEVVDCNNQSGNDARSDTFQYEAHGTHSFHFEISQNEIGKLPEILCKW